MGNTYQVRTVTQNGVGLPTSGGIIKEEHLNDEFTSIIGAFNKHQVIRTMVQIVLELL